MWFYIAQTIFTRVLNLLLITSSLLADRVHLALLQITKKVKESFPNQKIYKELPKKGLNEKGAEAGKKWDIILRKCIVDAAGMKDEEKEVAMGVIDTIKGEFQGFKFVQSDIPIYGFMTKKGSQTISFWNGRIDAIGWYKNNCVIVEWKVVELLDFWEKNTHAYGLYLHQCLVYARLLKEHLKLTQLPYIMIVPIDNITGKSIHLGLFTDYPQECKDKLEEYDWSIVKPIEKPETLTITHGNLINKKFKECKVVAGKMKLHDLFASEATVEDLRKAFNLLSFQVKQEESE